LDELIERIKVKKVNLLKKRKGLLTSENEKWQTLDDYLNLIKNIRKSKDFEKYFDPIRLRMYLIYPIKFSHETVFMTGVRAYRKGDFLKAATFF